MVSEAYHPDTKKVEVVNRYATPLAVLLVAVAILLTQPVSPVREYSIGLLVFGIVFNLGTAAYFQKKAAEGNPAEWLLPVRLYGNLVVNTLLIYYLGPYFAPMWLLLTLTPMATAIYGTRKQTMVSAVTVAVVVFGVQATREVSSPIDWGQGLVQVGYTFLLSLLANALVEHRGLKENS